MQSKFKVGDKVVVVKLDEHAGWKELEWRGKSGIIEDIYHGRPYPIKLEDKAFFSEDELEFEHIINSPLYKALK